MSERKNYKFNLTSFHINNFRVFDKETKFDLAPITILTGTNSSGKSSVTKALALLVKSYQKTGLKSLEFMASNLNLTGFNSIKNNLSGKPDISFELIFETIKDTYSLSLTFNENSLTEFKISKNDSLLQASGKDFSFIQLPEALINKEKMEDFFVGLPSSEIDIISKKILSYLSSDVTCHQNTALDFFKVSDSNLDFAKSHKDEVLDALEYINYSNTSSHYNSETGKEEIHTIYTGANPRLGDVVPEQAKQHGVAGIEISEVLNLEALNKWKVIDDELLQRFFSSFKFIGAIRATQQIIYTQSNSPEFFNILSDYILKGDAVEANMLLRKWIVEEFKLFKLKDEENVKDIFKVEMIESVGYLVRFLVNGVWTDLASLGYGVTQLFPIILKIATNANGNFIIEEPEANLHPALQSKLADFFVAIIKPKSDLDKMLIKIVTRSIIIETHSEYLIRRVQYLIADPESNCLPQDTTIYYFYNPVDQPINEPQVYKINIAENGSLTKNFGKGFLDETSNLSLLLYQALSNKN